MTESRDACRSTAISSPRNDHRADRDEHARGLKYHDQRFMRRNEILVIRERGPTFERRFVIGSGKLTRPAP